MGWTEITLAALNVFQAIALAWLAAWQQRAAHEVRKLNGTVMSARREGVASALQELERESGGAPRRRNGTPL
jgi:hypothetical protein